MTTSFSYLPINLQSQVHTIVLLSLQETDFNSDYRKKNRILKFLHGFPPLISPEKLFTYYDYKILVIYIVVLLFQLMIQENIVKVVSRYAVGSVFSTQCGAFSFFAIYANLGILTLWELSLKSQNAEACIRVDTGFLLVVLLLGRLQK